MRKSRLLRGTRRGSLLPAREDLPPRHPPEAVKKAVWERDEGRCQWCGTEDTLENPIQYDHIHPHRLGGENTVGNVELLCRKHNLEKGHKVYVRRVEDLFSQRLRRRGRAAV